ncbi:MAG: hypothetical protein BroJett014_13760 [Planctomycetota bacterium]|nr:MAG: hypothetical protein BroJett014_13760 [Planctomycetota bacterium]
MLTSTHSRARRTLALALWAAAFAALAPAQDASLKDVMARLEDPAQHERESAKADLAAHRGDLSRLLRQAMAGAGDNLKTELLEVAQARADAALVDSAAGLLGHDDERLAAAARAYLLALDRDALVLQGEPDERTRQHWADFLDYRQHFVIAQALIAAYLLPGKYFGQFEGLYRTEPDELDARLLALVSLEARCGEALSDAVVARLAQGPQTSEYTRNARLRRMSNSAAVKAAYRLASLDRADESVAASIADLGSSALISSLYFIQDLRVTAVRALAHSAAPEDVADRLAALHAESSRDYRDEMLRRSLDQEALREEMEVVLARFGRPDLLEARIERQRKRYERDAGAEVSVPSRLSLEVELQVRNDVAYLYLRAGDAQAAEREWSATAEYASSRLAGSTGRARSSLASSLGAIYYNLACAQSRQCKTSRAIVNLVRSVELGYADFAWMLEDGDLADLRETRAFHDWFNRVAPPAVADRLVAGR